MRIAKTTAPEAKRDAMLELRHDGETYCVQLRRVAAARRFILRVRGPTRDAVLTIPRRASLKDATDFAQRNAAWVGSRLRRLPEQVPFVDGAIFPLRGRPTRIERRPHCRGTVWLEEREEDSAVLAVTGEASHLERRVRDWLKAQARKALMAAVAEYAAMIGRPAPALSLRDTTTRWGSCSSSGYLNFSWRLIYAPPEILRYLAAHEVCHLAHMNHSAQFWELCRAICPQTDQAETWLKAHGPDLHRYGPRAAKHPSDPPLHF